MFITVYGKYGPQPPKNHVINTNLIQKIQTYQPLFGKEKYYDIWVQTDGYGPQYVYRVSRSEAKKLCDTGWDEHRRPIIIIFHEKTAGTEPVPAVVL